MKRFKSKLNEMYDSGIYDDEDEMYNDDYIEPISEPSLDNLEEPYEDEIETEIENEEEDEMLMNDTGYYESRPDWAKGNKEKIKEQDDSNEKKAMDSIKWLIQNDWGKSNEIEGQASERFKALSFNDSDISNKFLDEVNKFTSTLEDKYLK